MNRDLVRLKKQLEAIKKSNASIYLKLNDCIYKTIGASGLEVVESIPKEAKVEVIDCDKENFFYFFTINGKSHWTEILTVSEAKEKGKLE